MDGWAAPASDSRADVTSAGPGNDANLVAQALRDPNAYAPIVARYEAALGRYARRLLGGDAQAAEDVVQETFIKAYVNLNDYDRRRPFAPWLYRIAHNEAVSHLRRQGAGPRPIDGEDGALILARLSDGVDWSQRFAAADDARRLGLALDDLAPRYRDVLVLRYLEDKNYDEISDILQMPPGTVATLIRRGVAKLRALLSAPEPGTARGEP